jgi:hypothetical protein
VRAGLVLAVALLLAPVAQAQQGVFPSASAGTTFANPTGAVGASAVNGSASTAMRSDAAPALAAGAAAANLGFGLSGAPVAGDCAKWVDSTHIGDQGATCGSGGTGSPGGSSGQIEYNNAGAFGGVSVNGSGNVLEAAGTIAITSGKTLTASNSITLTGTDGTTMTFPSTSATIARTDIGQTFSGTEQFSTVSLSGLKNSTSGHYVDFSAAPSIGSGFGTGPALTPNGSYAFAVTIGTAPGTTGAITMNSTATNGWVCFAVDITTPGETVRETTYSTTAPGFTFYNASGTATAPNANDVVGFLCRAL